MIFISGNHGEMRGCHALIHENGFLWRPWLLALVFFLNIGIMKAQPMLMGVVTSAASGLPIVGATVEAGGVSTLTISGGVYSIASIPQGTFQITCSKPGYSLVTTSPVNFQPGVSVVRDFFLPEVFAEPVNLSASPDTLLNTVDLIWSPPVAPYELLYDDGVPDNFSVWAYEGNMNAVKFTPTGYPATISGGKVHIGLSSSYPSGSNPLTPFQMQVFKADGPNGTPGTALSQPSTVTPSNFGWVSFNFPEIVSLQSGSFFIVMIQGGNAPNAAGIAIDETNSQFRSFSRYVTGNSTWFPAGGNFMMRANISGPGGPGMFGDAPIYPASYQIWRLRQGEESNPAIWSLLGTTPQANFTDTLWNALPCGPYRWAVKASFATNGLSNPVFSNVIGKCWTAPVSVQVSTSCASSGPAGSLVQLKNILFQDTVYQASTDSMGTVNFTNVWKGTYKITISRFSYDTLKQTIPVSGGTSWTFLLLQVKVPPENLQVNDSSLMARWDVPNFEKVIFSEDWNSGNFNQNQWTLQPQGGNWAVSGTEGNPPPCAFFSSLPHLTGYNHSLVSRPIQGAGSTLLKLKYDVALDNFGTTSINQMAVEIWDGTGWELLKNYSNQNGNLSWTSEDLDISDYSGALFQIRFRATGGDSYDIEKWSVDNIIITASEPAQQQANCILGYYFYLGSAIAGYTTKNAFPIPPELVQYGTTYDACVRALYGSGYSDPSCTTFTSGFLYPVTNIQGIQIENSAYISWEKPSMMADTLLITPPGLLGYLVFRDNLLIDSIFEPETLEIYDYNLEPGIYKYGVAAYYDLTDYGFPGQFGHSIPAGPVHVTVSWGRAIPFIEPWNSGSFSFNEWTITPVSGNWEIDAGEGEPEPCARFGWQPPLTNYDISLISPPFNGLPFNCAAISLDFDLKLADRNGTGNEKLIVEVFYNNTWNKKLEFTNTGNIDWTHYSMDISLVRGKGFRIRFRAAGANSSDILNWYIDNIAITPVCYPASNPHAGQNGNGVLLSWSPPVCHGGFQLDEGFEQALFPPAQWVKSGANPAANWQQISSSSSMGTYEGNYAAGLEWDYNHQDEWLVAKDVYVGGNLTFWSYAFQGSLHLDHYYVKVSRNQGVTWEILLDLSELPSYPGPSGINDWNTPYSVNLSDYAGETIDIAWHAIDGDGQGLWYPWAIDNCRVGESDIFQAKPEGIIGYNVFRSSYFPDSFIKINNQPVYDTMFIDSTCTGGIQFYFVQSVFEECNDPSNSDTVMAQVITKTHSQSSTPIRIYPNPASETIIIDAGFPIEKAELVTLTGELIHIWETHPSTRQILTLPPLNQGIFFIRVFGKQEIVTNKLLIVQN